MKRLLSLLVAGLALAACSNAANTASTDTSSPSPAASATVNASPAESASPVASAAASATASPVPTVAVSYTDLAGSFGADKITDLAKLGVFDSTSGAFKPNDVITRRVFVRWLFKANNALWASDDSKQIRPATSGDQSAFKDIATSDPDFQYIQGLQTSGISVGFPDKSFRPESPLTREQALAIKSQLDKGGVNPDDEKDPRQALYELPNWKDKNLIGIEYVPAINTEMFNDNQKIDNVGRVFGAISALKPKQAMTRSQAALMLWKIGDHSMHSGGARTAADALNPAATATP